MVGNFSLCSGFHLISQLQQLFLCSIQPLVFGLKLFYYTFADPSLLYLCCFQRGSCLLCSQEQATQAHFDLAWFKFKKHFTLIWLDLSSRMCIQYVWKSKQINCGSSDWKNVKRKSADFASRNVNLKLPQGIIFGFTTLIGLFPMGSLGCCSAACCWCANDREVKKYCTAKCLDRQQRIWKKRSWHSWGWMQTLFWAVLSDDAFVHAAVQQISTAEPGWPQSIFQSNTTGIEQICKERIKQIPELGAEWGRMHLKRTKRCWKKLSDSM